MHVRPKATASEDRGPGEPGIGVCKMPRLKRWLLSFWRRTQSDWAEAEGMDAQLRTTQRERLHKHWHLLRGLM